MNCGRCVQLRQEVDNLRGQLSHLQKMLNATSKDDERFKNISDATEKILGHREHLRRVIDRQDQIISKLHHRDGLAQAWLAARFTAGEAEAAFRYKEAVDRVKKPVDADAEAG